MEPVTIELPNFGFTSGSAKTTDAPLTYDQSTAPVLTQSQFFTISFVSLAIGGAIACFGIVTNIINVKTFLSMGVKDGVTALFLAISISDLAYVFLIALRNPMDWMLTIERFSTDWLLTKVEPKAVTYFSDNCAVVMYSITMLTSTFLAVARTMCVVKPLHFKHMFTRSRCLKALVPMYLFPTACQSAVFVNMGVVDKFDETKNMSRPSLWLSSDRERVKDIVRLILGTIIPISSQILIVICVVVMVMKLKESAKFRNTTKSTGAAAAVVADDSEKETASTKLSGKEAAVVKQVVLISVIYIVLNIVKVFTSLLMAIDSRFDVGKSYALLYAAMHDVRVVFEVTNASVNIFVYYFFNSKFRSICFKC